MTLDDLLTATRDVPSADASPLSRARDDTLAAARDDVMNRARLVRSRKRRRVLYAAAAATVAAVAAVMVVAPGGDRTPERVATPVSPPVVAVQFTNASQIVDAAAASAGRGPAELGDAPYWRVVSEYAQSGSERPDENSEGKRTIWQGIDGPSLLRDTFGEDVALEDVRPLKLPRATLTVRGRTYTWREVNAGALDQQQIHDLLTEGEEGVGEKNGRAPHEWYFFKQAGELLGDTPASPAVRQAIWKEMATLTGITTSGKVTDALGRDGWDLTMSADGYGSQRFVVDPSTGAILQWETAGRGVTYRMTYLEAGPAETVPARGEPDR
ncbi:MAG: CU044_5270 family protein [Aeromicrobium sp.]